MRLIGIDFETNGIDPLTCDVVEVAWVIYDSDHGKGPILCRQRLNADCETMDPEAEKIHGINLERLELYGSNTDSIANDIMEDVLAYRPEFFFAHNARAFDRIIFNRLVPELAHMGWIDTMLDLSNETYGRLGTKKLEFMAARSGFLNPFPHSGISDVLTMGRILMEEDIEAVADRSRIPIVVVAADVGYETRELAKAQNYRWQSAAGKEFPKKWVKSVRSTELEEEFAAVPFGLKIVHDGRIKEEPKEDK